MRIRATLGFAFLLAALWAGAAEVSEYALKAEFIERFTRFINWPGEDQATDRPFVIGVVGRDPFGTNLQTLAERTIKNRPVELRYLDRTDDLGDCDVLFVSASERDALRLIVGKTSKRPVLTVGDTAGFAEAGIVINFYTEENHVHFEINERAAKACGLDIRAKLLKLARIVEAGN